jgi:dienelactone hydrolase
MIIFISLLFLELLLNCYRIQTKSKHSHITFYLRLFSLLMIFILMMSHVITWGFRYYVLVIFLVILLLIELITMIKKHTNIYRIKTYKYVLKTVGMWLLIFICSIPFLMFPEHGMIQTTGHFEVGTKVAYLTDLNRVEMYEDDGSFRSLTIEFWYPKNSTNELFPLIVFSHGSFGTRTSNETLYRELASHGYVVCSIDHTYQCFYTTTKDGHLILMDISYFNEINKENAKEHKEESLMFYQSWMNVRTADINVVIDEIKDDPDFFLEGLIDITKIGVIGHSLGGSAALGVGRIRDDINAVVALESPFMCDILDVIDNEFIFNDESYPTPVLNIYSDSSWEHLNEWPQYKQNYNYLINPTTHNFNIHIEGAYHLSLTDLSLVSPFLTSVLNGNQSSLSVNACLTRINHEVLSFLNCYLKDIGTYTP